ncbi:Mth938-like domain-containing protein [Wenzhouxiangella sp. EGI_FJ10305]|uniref:Mth938-like domain-containing protein n=1 Tax=Wenzhouxiangella sp. EGI_FJ10305 TaxID=3243768 RepID=UPI0035D6EA20
MDLTEHTAGNYHQIRGIEPHRVFVTDQWYTSSLLVGAHYLEPDWPVDSLAGLGEEHIGPLIELGPELVVFGAGQTQQFLPHAMQRAFFRQGIGVECMTLDAAARTFNVLMSENRRALAALIIG